MTTAIIAKKTRGPAVALAALVSIWFAAIYSAAATGALQNAPGQPPVELLVAVFIPLAVFAALYRGNTQFRQFVLGIDITVITMFQSWRVLGMMFMALFAFDVLPGLFAYPAGLGDALIGITAPLMVVALNRSADFAHSRRFVIWNWLGIFDFVVAFTTATMASGTIPGIAASAVTVAPMGVLPLVLIPGFLVPLFIILHLVALLAARHAAAQA